MLMERTDEWEIQSFIWFQDDFRILFYTGDMDLVCPPLKVAFGARRIAESNGMTVWIQNTGNRVPSYRTFEFM